MRKLLMLMAVLSLVPMAQAKGLKCKSPYTKISCEGVTDAKRSAFCYKGSVSEDKKLKVCQKEKEKRKRKKS